MNSCPHCHAELLAAHTPTVCPSCGRSFADTGATVIIAEESDSSTQFPLSEPDSSGRAGDDDRDSSSVATASMAADWETHTASAPYRPAEPGTSVDATGDYDKTFIGPVGSFEGPSDAHRPDADDATFIPEDKLELQHTHIVPLPAEWEAVTCVPGVSQDSSLKVGHTAGTNGQSTLVIKPRHIRLKDEDADDGRPADYGLMDMLGKGGMGVVYAARQASIDRTVAIKMLKPGTEKNVDACSKFLSEACVTGDLEHPNIVPIYDLGRDASGAFFYAMKRVQGTPWKNVIKEKSLEENLEILLRVADAVAFAHSKGIIHRDLKPENTMLGEFGEVLVMDWGLAMPIDPERQFGGMRQLPDIGGTPAYMAPEMVLGPLPAIGIHSDVYLLGAILFEIVTGLRPHRSTDTTGCLLNAANNVIQSTDMSGELVNIALKAIKTHPKLRHSSVVEFQNAIRTYLSHSESILLSDRAIVHLQQAKQSGEYNDFNKALFGFQQALELWDGNETAEREFASTRLDYARTARTKGDFDLAAGLLDVAIADHALLREEILDAAHQRDLRQQRARTYQRIGIALAVLLFTVVSGAAVWINRERNFALEKKVEAENNWQLAEERRTQVENEKAEVERQKVAVEEQRNEATRQEMLAKDNEAEARRQEMLAKDNMTLAQKKEREANEQRMLAEQKQREAIAARKAEAYEAYVARIGSAAARIDENAHDQARELLLQCIPENQDEDDLRNWEWQRLWYLCQQATATYETPFRVECLDAAWSPEGSLIRFAIGGDSGDVEIRGSDGTVVTRLQLDAVAVNAVAFTPDGSQLAIACDSESSPLQIVDAQSGRVIQTFDSVLSQLGDAKIMSLQFSADASRLLISLTDGTVRVQSLTEESTAVVLHGHRGPVTKAEFAPAVSGQNQTVIVTVSRDGSAIVWTDSSGAWTDMASIQQSPPFAEHSGPVFAIAFSPDGQTIATAGHDQRILLWKTSDLREFDFKNALETAERDPAIVASTTPYLELSGHTATVRDLAFSSNGRTLISAGHDNALRFWNVSTGEELKTLRGHGQWISAVRISENGNTAVSASYDRTVRQWDLRGYEELRILRSTRLVGHDDAVLDGQFSADSSRIVTASRDRTLQLWDQNTGQPLRTFREGHAFLVSSGVFSSDGSQLATAAVDGTVRLWNTKTGSERHVLKDTGRSAVAEFSPDGTYIVTGGPTTKDDQVADGKSTWAARIWNCQTGELLHELPGHPGRISAIAVSTDGGIVYCGDSTGLGTLWNTSTGQQLRQLKWHTAPLLFARFVNPQTLLTAASEKAVATWDLTAGTVDESALLKHPERLVAVDTDASRRLVATVCADRTLRIWDRTTGTMLKEVSVPFADNASDEPIPSISLSPKGDRIAISDSARRTARLFDVSSGQELLFPTATQDSGPFVQLRNQEQLRCVKFTVDGNSVLTAGGDQARLWDVDHSQLPFRRLRTTFSPHGTVASVAFAPDQQHVISGSHDGTAVIWNLDSGLSVRKLAGIHAAAVNCATFSPPDAAALILTTSDDTTAAVWNATTGRFIARLNGHAGRVLWGAFSSDGTRIVTTSADHTARVWKSDTREGSLHVLKHAASVTRAVFSADGTRLATACDDNTASVWDTATGQRLQHFAGHMSPVNSVAFTTDGKRLFTVSDDFRCKIWDTATGKELLTLKGHTREVSSVVFSATSNNLLTTSYDGTAIVWLTGR